MILLCWLMVFFISAWPVGLGIRGFHAGKESLFTVELRENLNVFATHFINYQGEVSSGDGYCSFGPYLRPCAGRSLLVPAFIPAACQT
jgi:hypothetical protein